MKKGDFYPHVKKQKRLKTPDKIALIISLAIRLARMRLKNEQSEEKIRMVTAIATVDATNAITKIIYNNYRRRAR